MNVIMVFTEPRERWAALGDGFRVAARVILWRGSDVLKAPLGAVFRHGDKWAVYQIVDGAARICDPFFSGLLTGRQVWGKFLKDYAESEW